MLMNVPNEILLGGLSLIGPCVGWAANSFVTQHSPKQFSPSVMTIEDRENLKMVIRDVLNGLYMTKTDAEVFFHETKVALVEMKTTIEQIQEDMRNRPCKQCDHRDLSAHRPEVVEFRGGEAA